MEGLRWDFTLWVVVVVVVVSFGREVLLRQDLTLQPRLTSSDSKQSYFIPTEC